MVAAAWTWRRWRMREPTTAPVIKTSSSRVFCGRRPAAKFARYLLNAQEIDAIYDDALAALESGNYAAFLDVVRTFERLETYIVEGNA